MSKISDSDGRWVSNYEPVQVDADCLVRSVISGQDGDWSADDFKRLEQKIDQLLKMVQTNEL